MCAVALAVNVPAVAELIVSVQVAVSLTTCGAAHVFDWELGAGVTDVVIESKLIGPTFGGPMTEAVTVNVCSWPTGLMPLGVMETEAFPQCLTRLSLPPGPALPFVERASGTPRTSTVAEALTMLVPAVSEVRTAEHEPVPPAV